MATEVEKITNALITCGLQSRSIQLKGNVSGGRPDQNAKDDAEYLATLFKELVGKLGNS